MKYKHNKRLITDTPELIAWGILFLIALGMVALIYFAPTLLILGSSPHN